MGRVVVVGVLVYAGRAHSISDDHDPAKSSLDNNTGANLRNAELGYDL